MLCGGALWVVLNVLKEELKVNYYKLKSGSTGFISLQCALEAPTTHLLYTEHTAWVLKCAFLAFFFLGASSSLLFLSSVGEGLVSVGEGLSSIGEGLSSVGEGTERFLSSFSSS